MILISKLTLISVLIFSINSYALSVEDYYKNTSNGYFNYFYPKLFQDPELGISTSEETDKKKFNEIFNIWLAQVDAWSFKKGEDKIYYLNLFYKINGKHRSLDEITLYFKDTQKINELLKDKNKTHPWNSNCFGIKFNPSLKVVSYIESNDIKYRTNGKNFEIFPDYLFFANSEMFEFFFKDWRIPIQTLAIENKKPIGFYIP